MYYDGEMKNKSHSRRFKAYRRIFQNIHAYSGIIRDIHELLRHNQGYSGIIEAYLEPFM